MNLVPHPFTLRQLQYAVAVANSLSFNKAADECHVSQPSLSAQTVLREAETLIETARRCCDPLTGTLRIGVIPTISPYLLPHLTPALRKDYPRLSLQWIEDKTHVLVRNLNAGAIDAAVLALEADIGDVEREVIARDPFVLVAPADHPLANKKTPAKPAELCDVNVLLLEDAHCFGKQAFDFCSRVQACDLEFRATSLSTIVHMVLGGAGVTLLPELAVSTEARVKELRVRAFADPAPGRTIGLVWRDHSPLSAAMRQLAVTLRTAYPAKATAKPARPRK